MLRSLVGSEMCIRDRYQRRVREVVFGQKMSEQEGTAIQQRLLLAVEAGDRDNALQTLQGASHEDLESITIDGVPASEILRNDIATLPQLVELLIPAQRPSPDQSVPSAIWSPNSPNSPVPETFRSQDCTVFEHMLRGAEWEQFYSHGVEALSSEQFEDAVREFSAAIDLQPRQADARAERAWALYRLDDCTAAMDDANLSIVLDPKHARGHHVRALVKYQTDDLEGCIQDCTSAVRQNPKQAESYCVRACAKLQLGRRHPKGSRERRSAATVAVQDLNESARLSPEYAEAFYNRGLAYVCLLYTSDAADEEDSVDLGGRRIINKKQRG
eukprot:TRINITY_DN19211_c0_g1_i2.p1 TRINITY_DN19211_c0_g1~~TRINITY_DN19211_c0_g1_i2.p1  ORF type:complete len:329 (+),score=77.93 TRINITY_DN19211_c0_g1_i2:99-1085(+)